MGGPEFAGRHPRRVWFVQFCPPPPYTGLLRLLGIVPWNDPTSGDIKAAATIVSQQLLPSLSSFALDPHVTFTTYVWQRVHFGIWKVGNQMLVVGVNLNPQVRLVPLTQLPGWKGSTTLEMVYSDSASFESGDLALSGLGSVGCTVTV